MAAKRQNTRREPDTILTAVVAPLPDELERLNRDLDKTAQFLRASLP